MVSAIRISSAVLATGPEDEFVVGKRVDHRRGIDNQIHGFGSRRHIGWSRPRSGSLLSPATTSNRSAAGSLKCHPAIPGLSKVFSGERRASLTSDSPAPNRSAQIWRIQPPRLSIQDQILRQETRRARQPRTVHAREARGPAGTELTAVASVSASDEPVQRGRWHATSVGVVAVHRRKRESRSGRASRWHSWLKPRRRRVQQRAPADRRLGGGVDRGDNPHCRQRIAASSKNESSTPTRSSPNAGEDAGHGLLNRRRSAISVEYHRIPVPATH